jgi:uncharacterized protein
MLRMPEVPRGALRGGWRAPLCLALLLALIRVALAATEFDFHPPARASDPVADAAMRDLAVRILPVYQDDNADRYLSNLSALQLVAGNGPAAYATRQSLRDRKGGDEGGVNRTVTNDLYAHALALEAQQHLSFPRAFSQAYREAMPRLDDPAALSLETYLSTPPRIFEDSVQRAFDQWRAKGSIPLPDALWLISTYLGYEQFRSFAPLIGGLNAEDDHRRYIIEPAVAVDSGDETAVAVVVIRPRAADKPLPTLLEFTLRGYPQVDAKESAAHGYAGVVAFGPPRGPQRRIVPFEHGGETARAVIDWITSHPWSDGRIGMYGASYGAFATWAVTRQLPPALKAIMASDATAPGIDFPMRGSIYQNEAFRWSYCVTHTRTSERQRCADEGIWHALNVNWYKSGRRYRDLDGLFGKINPIFRRWLNHPSFDDYWRSMLPDERQLAALGIPVLETTGYFATEEIGTLYYFSEHLRANPKADHTLLIGPFDEGAPEEGPAANLRGYGLDAAALIDLRALRYQWFDSVLKGSPRPALLADRVNYEVMGANAWRHVPSIEGMSDASVRYYLSAAPEGKAPASASASSSASTSSASARSSAASSSSATTRASSSSASATSTASAVSSTAAASAPPPPPAAPAPERLSRRRPVSASFVAQTVDWVDRNDAEWTPSLELQTSQLSLHYGIAFESEPLTHSLELSGLFSARLDFLINKVDVDLTIALYEHRASGEYVRLMSPASEFRASYARDRAARHLLAAGERQQLTVHSERLVSAQLAAGSRLVVVLSVVKRPDMEINYGAGADVSEESIEDGRVPLRIRWYGSSYIELPVRR